ncbi:MAG: type II secretion system protein, partial [Bacilli bacterium]
MKIMKNRKKSKAFTLIELVAVIIILGITLLVAVPMVTRAVRKSKLELMASQENTLKLIGKDYFLSNREALPKEIGEASSVSIKTLIKEGYTKEV